MFKKNSGKMYNLNAYYDVIDDNYLQLPQNRAFSSLIYIINDVIMCSDVKHFPVCFFSKHKFRLFS